MNKYIYYIKLLQFHYISNWWDDFPYFSCNNYPNTIAVGASESGTDQESYAGSVEEHSRKHLHHTTEGFFCQCGVTFEFTQRDQHPF